MTGDLERILTGIRDSRGSLTPEVVLEEATDPGHPLHSRFEWDDSAAGHAYRLLQAGQLLRVVKISDPAAPADLRAFTAVKQAESHRSEYVPTGEALADPFTRQLILREMEREWRTFQRRWQHMAEYADLIAGAREAG